jgi:hypothetical protein
MEVAFLNSFAILWLNTSRGGNGSKFSVLMIFQLGWMIRGISIVSTLDWLETTWYLSI